MTKATGPPEGTRNSPPRRLHAAHDGGDASREREQRLAGMSLAELLAVDVDALNPLENSAYALEMESRERQIEAALEVVQRPGAEKSVTWADDLGVLEQLLDECIVGPDEREAQKARAKAKAWAESSRPVGEPLPATERAKASKLVLEAFLAETQAERERYLAPRHDPQAAANSRRLWRAIMLSPSVDVLDSLLAGEPVPESALDAEWMRKLTPGDARD